MRAPPPAAAAGAPKASVPAARLSGAGARRPALRALQGGETGVPRRLSGRAASGTRPSGAAARSRAAADGEPIRRTRPRVVAVAAADGLRDSKGSTAAFAAHGAALTVARRRVGGRGASKPELGRGGSRRRAASAVGPEVLGALDIARASFRRKVLVAAPGLLTGTSRTADIDPAAVRAVVRGCPAGAARAAIAPRRVEGARSYPYCQESVSCPPRLAQDQRSPGQMA